MNQAQVKVAKKKAAFSALPSSKTLRKWDQTYVWHPFTQMQDWQDEDFLIIDSAKGNYLIDTEGKRYLDGVSSLWCNIHGHRVKKLDQAIKKQVGKVAHSTFLGLSSVPAIHLAKKLIEIVPKGLTRVFYSDSGSEACEIAIKMSYQYWQLKGETKRTKFVRLTNAYHGDTVGSVSMGGIDLFHQIFKPLLFKSIGVAAPDRYHESFDGTEEAYLDLCAKRLEAALKKHKGEICAVMMEPLVQGAAGMITQPKGYISRARALTKKYNTLLVFDEVATGFGRTGRMFASEHESVTPDILCLAKGLSGGYLPLAATVTTETIYKAFLAPYEDLKAFFHGHTFTANPLACAVSLANLRIFDQEGTLQKLSPKIALLSQLLKRFWKLKHVGDVRQIGFMVGIELVCDQVTQKPYQVSEKIGIRVIQEARRNGVAIRPLGNVIILMPPLSTKASELGRLANVTYQSIKKVTEG
jgi:adenosylmethionine---8-amino-7-oxononanoate aminotransferase